MTQQVQRTSSMKLTPIDAERVEIQYFGVGTQDVVGTEIVSLSAFSPVMQDFINGLREKKGA